MLGPGVTRKISNRYWRSKVSDPDTIVEYVKWLDKRFNRLVNAIQAHRVDKQYHAIEGSIDQFDRELWKNLDWAYSEEE